MPHASVEAGASDPVTKTPGQRAFFAVFLDTSQIDWERMKPDVQAEWEARASRLATALAPAAVPESVRRVFATFDSDPSSSALYWHCQNVAYAWVRTLLATPLSVQAGERARWDLGSDTRGEDHTKYRFWVVRRSESGQSVVMSESFKDPDTAAAELSRLRDKAVALSAAPATPEPAAKTTFPQGAGTGTYFRRLPNNAWAMLNSGGQWVSIAAPTWQADPAAAGREIVRHLKRGTEYEVLHQGVELQVAVARGEPRELLETTLDPEPVCWEGDKLVIYRGADGKMWAREESEFRDGRFETVSESCSTLSASTADGETAGEGEDWRDDPSADERWDAGLDFAMEQLCSVLGVDPKAVCWDAATETLDGDVCSVIGNILTVWGGDDWRDLPTHPTPTRPDAGADADAQEGR